MNHRCSRLLASLVTLALLVSVVLAMSGCHDASKAAAPSPMADVKAEPIKVQVVEAALRTWPKKVRVQGNFVGDEEAVIGAKVAGRLGSVKVDLGASLKQGQVVASLEAEEFTLKAQQADAKVSEARAMLGLKPGVPLEKLDRARTPAVLQELALWEDAQAQYERSQALANRNAIALEEKRRLEAQVRVARAKHAAALNQVDNHVASLQVAESDSALAKQIYTDSTIKAPFDGVVSERYVAPGVYVQVGQPIVTLVRTNPLRFRGGVPEREALNLKTGQPLSIEIEGWAEPIAATVSRVSPSIDQTSRSLTFEADVPNPDGKLRAGLFAEAAIVVDPEAKALTIPRAALIEFAGVEKVWVIDDGQAAEKKVLTGRRDAQYVEILDGVKAGTRISANGKETRPGPVVVAAP